MVDGVAELKAIGLALLGIITAVGGWLFRDVHARLKTVEDGKASVPEMNRQRDAIDELWRAHARTVDSMHDMHTETMGAIGEVSESVARIEGKLDK